MKMLTKITTIVSLILLTSCSSSPLNVDVSDVEVALKIHRLDEDMFGKPTEKVIEDLPDIMIKYGQFFDTYASILNFGNTGNSDFSLRVEEYLNDIKTLEIKEVWKEQYSDFNKYEEGLTDGFKHFKYYFPDIELPEIYACITAFNYSAFTTETDLGIGVDLFFGTDNDIYKTLPGRHNYMNLLSAKERLKVSGLEAWSRKLFPFNDSIDNVLSNAVYEGKILYFLNAMFPEMPDYLIIGYSKEQIKWCDLSEKNMWDYLVDKKLFFSTDKMDIKKLTGPGAFTHYFSHKSPGGAGKWIGWQIVHSYVKNNNIKLADLMYEQDYHKIFNRAKYKPN